jgi:hypothetical protein
VTHASTFMHPVLDDFVRSDSRAMVAAALHILGVMADDAEKRHHVIAPWAWDLRQRARAMEARGQHTAASQAKVVARMINAVALGEISSAELLRSASTIDVNVDEFQDALAMLEAAMRQGMDVDG